MRIASDPNCILGLHPPGHCAFPHLQGRSDAIGTVLEIGAVPFEVVGIIDGHFQGTRPFLATSVWIPITAVPASAIQKSPRTDPLNNRDASTLAVWGVLKPGSDFETARREMTLIGTRLDDAFPSRADREWTLIDGGRVFANTELLSTIGGLLLIGVVVVLLVVCTNLANLSLARAASQRLSTAIRSAIGASRDRLVFEHLAEIGLIVLVAGAFGTGIVLFAAQRVSIEVPIGNGAIIPVELHLDATVLAASAIAMALTMVVLGLWPALQASRTTFGELLGTGVTATPPNWRFHRNVIAWQVCASVSLLIVAAVAAKAAKDTGTAVELPYETLGVAEVDFTVNGRNKSQTDLIVDQVLANLDDRAQVEHVAASTGLPFGPLASHIRGAVAVPETRLTSGVRGTTPVTVIAVTHAFFATTGLPLVRGRPFEEVDRATNTAVVIVSERVAHSLSPEGDIVGDTIALRLGTDQPIRHLRVVGVSTDVHTTASASRAREGLMFVPFAQRPVEESAVTFIVRANRASSAAAVLRDAIHTTDSQLAVSVSGTGELLFLGPSFFVRLLQSLASALGALALALALTGLFGVLSQVIVHRRREMAIRLVLGANRPQLIAMIIKEGMHPIVKGVMLGLAVGVLSVLVVRVSIVNSAIAIDPFLLARVSVLFGCAGLVACLLPAIRASRADPAAALRQL